MTAEGQSAAGVAARGNWHEIEPILKWAGVAYGFGFLIVLVHTYRLGIPMLQLIEPVNVWIGTPLAIVAFFLDKIFEATRRATGSVMALFHRAAEIREELNQDSADLEKLFYRVSDIWLSAMALFAAPLGLLRPAERLLRWVFRAYIKWAEKAFGVDALAFLRVADGTIPAANRQLLLDKIEPILKWSLRVAAVGRFLNVLVLILFLVLACWVYVELFPTIPQALGGGRPEYVELLMSPESLPQGKGFEDWRTEIPSAKPEMKQSVLVDVTLYFRTEHELIVQKGKGPVISLSDHAVEGIVFPPRSVPALK